MKLEPVSIPLSFFDYVAEFERPIFAMWLNRAEVVQAAFDALKPWNISVENLRGLNEGAVAEQGFELTLPSSKAKFRLSPAQFGFKKDSADWSQAEEIIKMLAAGLTAVLKSSGAVVNSQKGLISLHIQPKTRAVKEILQPFWSTSLTSLNDSSVVAVANIVKWENATLTIDGSAAVKNGAYLRIERTFPASSSFQEIGQALLETEQKVLTLLGVEEER